MSQQLPQWVSMYREREGAMIAALSSKDATFAREERESIEREGTLAFVLDLSLARALARLARKRCLSSTLESSLCRNQRLGGKKLENSPSPGTAENAMT